MYAPTPATQLRADNLRDGLVGVCQYSEDSNPNHGWFVRYRRIPRYSNAYEAVMSFIVVEDSSGGVAQQYLLKFLIDTGSPYTIIPRQLLQPDPSWGEPFLPSRALGPFTVGGIGGGSTRGYRFHARISLYWPRRDPRPFSFDKLEVIVVDSWKDNYGILGLDALRQVVIVSDSNHLCLWPPPRSSRQSEANISVLGRPIEVR